MKLKELITELRNPKNENFIIAEAGRELTEEDASELRNAIENFKSEKFSLLSGKEPFTSEFICIVLNAVKNNPNIKKFTFGFSSEYSVGLLETIEKFVIDDNVTSALSDLIKANKTLTEIHIQFLGISDDKVLKVTDALKKNLS